MITVSDVHRRQFFRQSAAAATIFSVGPEFISRLIAAESKPSAMSFGIVTYNIGKDWDLPTLIANCEATDVLGVELRTTHAHSIEPTIDARKRTETKQRFADSRVSLVGLGTDEDFDNPDSARLRSSIERTKGFIKLAHDLGTTGVKVKPNRFWPKVPREQTIQQIGEALLELGTFASNYGQQIRLEIHGQCSEPTTIKTIIDIASHPNVRVCWNSNPTDLRGDGLEHNFNLVRDRFGDTCHVHRLNDERYPYAELIALLVKSRYSGWVLLEDRDPADDRLAEISEQRELFGRLVANAKGA